jgi:hypothetical protein
LYEYGQTLIDRVERLETQKYPYFTEEVAIRLSTFVLQNRWAELKKDYAIESISLYEDERVPRVQPERFRVPNREVATAAAQFEHLMLLASAPPTDLVPYDDRPEGVVARPDDSSVNSSINAMMNIIQLGWKQDKTIFQPIFEEEDIQNFYATTLTNEYASRFIMILVGITMNRNRRLMTIKLVNILVECGMLEFVTAWRTGKLKNLDKRAFLSSINTQFFWNRFITAWLSPTIWDSVLAQQLINLDKELLKMLSINKLAANAAWVVGSNVSQNWGLNAIVGAMKGWGIPLASTAITGIDTIFKTLSSSINSIILLIEEGKAYFNSDQSKLKSLFDDEDVVLINEILDMFSAILANWRETLFGNLDADTDFDVVKLVKFVKYTTSLMSWVVSKGGSWIEAILSNFNFFAKPNDYIKLLNPARGELMDNPETSKYFQKESGFWSFGWSPTALSYFTSTPDDNGVSLFRGMCEITAKEFPFATAITYGYGMQITNKFLHLLIRRTSVGDNWRWKAGFIAIAGVASIFYEAFFCTSC